MKPQTKQILRILEERGSLTAREAMNLSPACFRLAARIDDIRKELGASYVTTVMESHANGKHARYKWTPPVASGEQVSLAL